MEPSDKDATMPAVTKAEKNLNIFHPGNIAYACQRDGGRYSGSKLDRFANYEAVNHFFGQSKNFVALDMWLEQSSGYWYVLYTNFMEAEEWEDFQAIQEEVTAAMAKRREARAKSKLNEATEEEKAVAEAKRLQEVGKKCEQNHSKKARKK